MKTRHILCNTESFAQTRRHVLALTLLTAPATPAARACRAVWLHPYLTKRR